MTANDCLRYLSASRCVSDHRLAVMLQIPLRHAMELVFFGADRSSLISQILDFNFECNAYFNVPS